MTDPVYYLPWEVKYLLDLQRRRHRRNVALIVLMQFVCILPLRIGIDKAVSHPGAPELHWLQPYVILVPVVFVVAIWTFAMKTAFIREKIGG